MTNEDLENRFMHHVPKTGQPEMYAAIRQKALELAKFINEKCPESREKSVAITKLEECMFWSNASVARN